MTESQYKVFSTARELLKFVKEFEGRSLNRYCQDISSPKFGDENWRPNLGERVRLYWKNSQAKIPFDGVPFIFGGVKAWRCHLGPDLCKRKKEKYRQERDRRELEGNTQVKRRTPPETKKLGCPAMIHAHRLAKFPDFKVSSEGELTKRTRDRVKQLLVEAADSRAGVQVEVLYLLRLPLPAHHNHPIPYTSVRSRSGGGRSRAGRVLCDRSEPLLTAVTGLAKAEFLHTFRVTRDLYQFLVEEWHKEEEGEQVKEERGSSECVMEQCRVCVLAALYYLGSLEALPVAADRFHMPPADYLMMVTRCCEFLARQQEKYITLPMLEERLVIADGFKRVSGFSGVMGTLDAVVIPLSPTPTPAPTSTSTSLVLQYIVDHTLVFRDLHLALLPTPAHTRLQVFQESGAWEWLACLTSCETHVVAPAVYPLAPAILTPHMKDILLYQEALYNENHLEARRVGWRAISLLKTRFKRLGQLKGGGMAGREGAAGGKGGDQGTAGGKAAGEGGGVGMMNASLGDGGRDVIDGRECENATTDEGKQGRERRGGRKGRGGRAGGGGGGEGGQQGAMISLLLVRAACVLHNMALMNEQQSVLDAFWVEQERSGEGEGWGQAGKEDESGSGGVAEFGLLGGEEKRHFLTTTMTDRFDGSLPDMELAGGFGS